MISPTKFLTAGHCSDTAEGAASARVYFQQDAGANYDPITQVDPVTGYPEYCAAGTQGTLCATSDELYNYGFANFAGFPNTHDVGLVILDQPIAMPEYGQLPAAGELDGLDKARGTKDTIFTVSGYGLTYRTNANSPLPNISFRSRLMGLSTLVNLNSTNTDGYNLQTQGNGDEPRRHMLRRFRRSRLPRRTGFQPDRWRHLLWPELPVPWHRFRLPHRSPGSA